MIKYKLWSDNPTITPLREALLFHVREHSTKEIKYHRVPIVLHSFLLDNDMCDPNSEILVKVTARVGDTVHRGLIYYQNRYWATIKDKNFVNYAIPFDKYLALTAKWGLDAQNLSNMDTREVIDVDYLELHSGGPVLRHSHHDCADYPDWVRSTKTPPTI